MSCTKLRTSQWKWSPRSAKGDKYTRPTQVCLMTKQWAGNSDSKFWGYWSKQPPSTSVSLCLKMQASEILFLSQDSIASNTQVAWTSPINQVPFFLEELFKQFCLPSTHWTWMSSESGRDAGGVKCYFINGITCVILPSPFQLSEVLIWEESFESQMGIWK